MLPKMTPSPARRMSKALFLIIAAAIPTKNIITAHTNKKAPQKVKSQGVNQANIVKVKNNKKVKKVAKETILGS